MKKIITLLVLVAFGAVIYSTAVRRNQEREPFTGVLQRYGIVDFQGTESITSGTIAWNGGKIVLPAGPSYPTRNGKIMVIRPPYTKGRMYFGEGGKTREEENARIDPVWYELDPAIRAMTPDEVGTLVLAEWGRTGTGAYVRADASGKPLPQPVEPSGRPVNTVTLGAKAVFLKIYDMKSQVLVGSWLLVGEPPPDAIAAADVDDLDGPPLVEFLKGMPGK